MSEFVKAGAAGVLIVDGAEVVGDFHVKVLGERWVLKGEDYRKPFCRRVRPVLWKDEVHF